MVDNNSRYSFMFGELDALEDALDFEYRISAGRIGELKRLKASDVLLVQIDRNFNFNLRGVL